MLPAQEVHSANHRGMSRRTSPRRKISKMFQIPVENLDNIRKVRKKVKSILMDIGLDSCKELLKDLKGFDPGEKYFYNTSWGDISLWEPSGKKVPLDL
ncbi:activity-dependent neuroprotector homeobox protein 2 isoform X4 [Lagenorhynchus albirostris]|uniref:activity-dependent neuroprotector homeobox protein 2 isoform X4 n=1 Tax=Lagenorhynchus albirostris TaxID=27610 RepID=UPI0028ECC7C2|nr:activity-dependent neuroprotector homeobox protein 2 isoform X4 [Lagenorhynchus albirostris]